MCPPVIAGGQDPDSTHTFFPCRAPCKSRLGDPWLPHAHTQARPRRHHLAGFAWQSPRTVSWMSSVSSQRVFVVLSGV